MLEQLRRIILDVNAAHSLDDALDIIVERIKKTLNADVCSVYLNDPETHDHVLMASDGLRQSAVNRLRIPKGQGITGLVSSRAEIYNLEDAPTHENFRFFHNTGEAPYHGFLGIPIIQRGNSIGVIVVQHKNKHKFSDDDESFVATLAAQLAGSLSLVDIQNQLGRHGDEFKTNLIMSGSASSTGISFGEAFVLYSGNSLRRVPDKAIDDIEPEISRFIAAIKAEKVDLSNLNEQLKDVLSPGDRALFDAYGLLLESDQLIDGTTERIREGNWAPAALRDTIAEYANIFEEMDDAYLAGRAADIRDIGLRLLKRLESEYRIKDNFPDKTVLFGQEIGVSELLEVPREKLVGIVSLHGTSASHIALLARGMGIPAVFGLEEITLERLNGRTVIVDGYSRQICLEPSGSLLEEYQALIQEESELSKDLNKLKNVATVSADGEPFSLMANAGIFADIEAAKMQGAEGVGLYRTELLFHLRDNFPSEEIQTETYLHILNSIGPKPVVFRTLDVGGDKPLSYFPIEEQNPFLGWRGIRISLDQISLFKAQLRALLKASAMAETSNQMSIMFPMISSISEVREAKNLVKESLEELLEEGYQLSMPKIGVMIEVPSAAFLTGRLAPEVDFFSIGSNDLTQYLLAVDRNNERVAGIYNYLHPAVLYAIHNSAKHAQKHNKPVSVCGEMAGDPIGALVLMGMNIRSLSMSMGNLLKAKWVINSFTMAEAEALYKQAIRIDCEKQTRELYEEAIIQRGLGGLVRAGKK